MKVIDFYKNFDGGGLRVVFWENGYEEEPLWEGSYHDTPYWVTELEIVTKEENDGEEPISYRDVITDENGKSRSGLVFVIK